MSSKINTAKEKPKRLLALDILRGITIAGMILVNNPGSWGNIYAPLRHAEWNGLTPTDLVFPFFMFIMGMSTYMSLRKFDFKPTWPVIWKIVRRAVIIFAIGIGIVWLSRSVRGLIDGKSVWDAVCNFDTIRILGVFPRLAICYGIGALVAVLLKMKQVIWFVVLLLVAYTVILLTGNGFEFADTNVIYILDHKVLGEDHLYHDTVGGITLAFDPEGLLSTLPSIAHMLIGFICGGLIMSVKDNKDRIIRLFLVGTVLTFCGFLLSYGLPINKKIWSPTFVLTTCGLASLTLGLLIWIIDIKGHKRWCRFFEVFGINPLFLYCLATILSIAMGMIRVPYAAAASGSTHLKGYIYEAWLMPLAGGDATLASLIFALSFVAVNWLVGVILYKKKIYIKI